jgi:Tol biopolymer transport system component
MSADEFAMKRAEVFWQGVVLFLVLCITVGIYVALAWIVRQVRPAERVQVLASAQDGAIVRIVEPIDGSVSQAGKLIPVRATIVKPHFFQVEFQVDGNVVAAQSNPDPQSAPWLVEWTWAEAGEGTHRLSIQARGSGADVAFSTPVTVAVVPAGQIVLASNRDGAYALYAMQTDGHGAVRLTTGPGDARQPAMKGDGLLALVAEGEAGQTTIRQMAVAGGEETDLFAGREPAWSVDGKRLAFSTSLAGVSQVVVADAAGHGPLPVTAETVYAGQPSWSPDGSHLAYVAERDRNLDIWIAALDGSDPHRLTDDPAVDWSPAWSPDGNWLAFVSNRSGSYQLYIVRVDGSDLRLLTDFSQGAESPAWSPDGYWLAFVAYTGDGTGVDAREIYVMRADGRDQVRLTNNNYDDTEPNWAPDWTRMP